MATARTQTCRPDRAARGGPHAGPPFISPACRDAKLEDHRAFPGGRRLAARYLEGTWDWAWEGSTGWAGHGQVGIRNRTAGDVQHMSAARGENRPFGKRASRHRKSKTPSARSATAGTRPDAARPKCGSPDPDRAGLRYRDARLSAR